VVNHEFVKKRDDTMSAITKRSTIYFDPALHRALRVKAAETSRSVSEFVNDAVREKLSEDADDLAAFDERSPEPLISYEEMLKRLRAADGHIWRLFRKSVASDLARIPEQVGGS